VVTERNETIERYAIQDFATERGALSAIRALQEAGFSSDSISVVARDEGVAQGVMTDAAMDETESGESVVTGMTAGGVVGAAAALLIGATTLAVPGLGIAIGGPLVGALAGAAGGGLIGGLIGLGVPNEEAEYYAERANAGRILVVVAAGSRVEEARGIMLGTVDLEDAEAGIYADRQDSTGNTILDQGIATHTVGITPPVDTVIGQEPDEGYTVVGDESDREQGGDDGGVMPPA
jgi:hypothetical protein